MSTCSTSKPPRNGTTTECDDDQKQRVNGHKDHQTASNTNKETAACETSSWTYLQGFGNELESSCWPGALPVGRNNPRHVPYGLYTEQISGTAFTKPRSHGNRRTWLYRIQPRVSATVGAPAQALYKHNNNNNTNNKERVYFGHTAPSQCEPVVDPLRWHPRPLGENSNNSTPSSIGNTKKAVTFVQGCHLMCHGGSVEQKHGLAIYMYQCNASMNPLEQSMQNTDGDFLLLPQQHSLIVTTELGPLHVSPQELVVVPRGICFSIQLDVEDTDDDDNDDNAEPQAAWAQGYVLEVYGGDGFQLPDLGLIGANGLANARDFQCPTAAIVTPPPHNKDDASSSSNSSDHTHVTTIKMQSQLWHRTSDHGPYTVVAWHGNYVPYKYDLNRFVVVNSVSHDHLDPSIFTVLTCPSHVVPGTALADVVVFAPRYLATDSQTFRPPYFHSNTMSEYMGLISGQYDAKPLDSDQNHADTKQKKSSGFVPGGASLHNCMTPHGPNAQAYHKAIDPQNKQDSAVYLHQGMAFMFETYLPLHVAPAALSDPGWRDVDYATSSWQDLSPSPQALEQLALYHKTNHHQDEAAAHSQQQHDNDSAKRRRLATHRQ